MSETVLIAIITTMASVLGSALVFVIAWKKSNPEVRKTTSEGHAQEADAAETALRSTELATKQLIDMQRRMAEQDRQLIALRHEVEQVKAENEAIREKMAEMQAENERLSSEEQAAKRTVQSLRADLERALNEIKYLRMRVRGRQDSKPVEGGSDADKRGTE